MRLGTDLGPGVLCCTLIGALSYLSNAYFLSKVSALLWAFIYSILIANLIKLPYGLDTGINFCSTNLLRFAVIVLALTISIVTWTTMGFVGVVQVILGEKETGWVFGVDDHGYSLLKWGRDF